ncbi:diacylglycerol kinase family lipid kinase [Paeniglutamicibacter gangotriensis]|uniref:Diacylglycerol kinase family lipid kinase n=1 Tax=Paeniglutamicibacter gangotriensis TaxID=254787 RepID=A0A5B0EQA8_9MICC|nr:diacylglycerol kinase family protein [Paeniglutamicibacter gangotriensis]KAA0979469.1 diacylglycerol kinase family lipid kinase [Paeniglutamicibacter gangotriensis]
MQRNRLIALISAGAAGTAATISWLSVRRLVDRNRPTTLAPVVDGVSSARKVALVINPSKSGTDEAISAVKHVCAEAGLAEPLVLESTVEDAGQGAAHRALEAGCDLIIAAGGDGTVRAVAEVLRDTEATLGLIPLGTGNLLARNVEVPLEDIGTAALGAVRGPVRTIDTGSITLEHVDGHTSEHAFLVIAGVGTDADVMDDTNEDLKAKVGWLAYSEAGFRHLPGKRKKISIALDGGNEQTRSVRSVLFANCGKLQGLDLVPEAKINDGVLDVVMLSPRSAAGWAWIFLKTAFRARGTIPVMGFYPSATLAVRCHEPMNTQIDGDGTGLVNGLRVEVRPGSLKIRVA